MEAEAGVKHFEDGGRGHKPKTAGVSRKWKRESFSEEGLCEQRGI